MRLFSVRFMYKAYFEIWAPYPVCEIPINPLKTGRNLPYRKTVRTAQ
jgi:hypothetical protein